MYTGATALGAYATYQVCQHGNESLRSIANFASHVFDSIISSESEGEVEKNDESKKSNSPNNKKDEKKSPWNLQKQIDQDKSPSSIIRADKGRGPFEKDHIHFKDGAALNSDGTWKHGVRELSRQEADWLKTNGWIAP